MNLMLNNQMRLLWEQHVFWTRLVISGIVFDSPDLSQSTARLLRNPADFASVLKTFYGEEKADEFQKLFTEHLTIAGQLVSELKAGENTKAAETEKKWYENADQIAAFLASINPYWSQSSWQEMLYSHLELTAREASEFLSQNFAASVNTFDQIEQEAMEMADMMTRGIILQFNLV